MLTGGQPESNWAPGAAVSRPRPRHLRIWDQSWECGGRWAVSIHIKTRISPILSPSFMLTTRHNSDVRDSHEYIQERLDWHLRIWGLRPEFRQFCDIQAPSVHKLFQKIAILEASVSLVLSLTNPPASLPCKNLLTLPFIYSWESLKSELCSANNKNECVRVVVPHLGAN